MNRTRVLLCTLSAFGLIFFLSVRSSNVVAGDAGDDEDHKGAAPQAKAAAAFPAFPVVVDCSQTLEQMVKAGKYDWMELDIHSSDLQVNCRGISKVDVVLVPMHGPHMEPEDLLRELDSRGFRPAELPELLAFGATYPEKQREFPPIVGLGSGWQHWDTLRGAAFLGAGTGGRGLGGPGCWGPACHSDYHLAAVVRN